ncbi:MAG: type II toxin-antitoxin system VapC family toxin [Methyloceanibacter sp.]|nr:type II toxin-antitoxin system VapC family toxin [Methyloceanibacter sp.]
MRVLLDTHIVLCLLRRSLETDFPRLASILSGSQTASFVSVATFWEIAIKTRLGKLDPGMPLEDIAGYLQAIGATALSIEIPHVMAAVDPEPSTRDPFDRLLLAQCQVEQLLLATADRTLAEHRLALKT